jgi:import inner membrane translocase subunit TIM17
MREPHPDITPYPDFIIDAAGFGFVAGGIIGFPYHFIKGIYNSPSGRRLAAGAQSVRINTPPLVGVSAAYLALVEIFHYTMISARKKDDFWSHVLPSFAAGACLSVGRGPRAVATTAFCCLGAATTVYTVRHFGCPSPPPFEDPGQTPPSVVDSSPSRSVRDADLGCTHHISSSLDFCRKGILRTFSATLIPQKFPFEDPGLTPPSVVDSSYRVGEGC